MRQTPSGSGSEVRQS